MALFGKKITDDEWSEKLNSSWLFGGLRTISQRYDESLKFGPDGDFAEKFMAMNMVASSFPEILKEVKDIGEPQSATARQIRTNLVKGIESYLKSANNGMRWAARLMEEKFDGKAQSLQDTYEYSGSEGKSRLASVWTFFPDES